jgi:hypothetical protein
MSSGVLFKHWLRGVRLAYDLHQSRRTWHVIACWDGGRRCTAAAGLFAAGHRYLFWNCHTWVATCQGGPSSAARMHGFHYNAA